MDSENETRGVDSEVPTEEEKLNVDIDQDTNKVCLDVKNVDSDKEPIEDSVATGSEEKLLENNDKNLSNVDNVQEQCSEEEPTKESQTCVESVNVDSHSDVVEPMQIDTVEQMEQENLSKAQNEEDDSVSISKDIDGISDMESQDPLDQTEKKNDVESITNVDDVCLSDDAVDESGTNANNLDDNSVETENKNDEAPEIVNSPEVMDISNTNKDNDKEIDNDTEKCNATENERDDKSPVNSDSGEKESTLGKSSHEQVNTEFVQIISQEKQDDSQIENHSIMDAEDPFGGDNLITENDEQSENDAIAKSKANFEEGENETISNEEKTKSSDENSSVKDVEVNIVSEVVKESEKTEEKELEENSESKTITDNEEKDKADDKEGEKEKIDTEPSILPGQDDELCIIPDSMKEVEDNEKVTDTPKEVEQTEKILEDNAQSNEKSKATSTTEAKEKSPVNENSESETVVRKELPKVQTVTKVTQSITDVIDIEDDLEKVVEVEEIQSTETCKQCNQVKVCKIKVKVGTDLFSVCSKACKSAFKSANNKAMDIPSDGVNSKREKRCASCLLIIESNDERCLSWETMEFCNEECLGKFQTKYGSYCRNCNGSVQPVSLGKYCVRFGYDVRQFCCSVCLEEFKKGLKVCTYCQKDISAGTEGFLAPVGDKGQFKDFCTQDCMEKYSRMSSTEPPIAEKKACSVCQEVN